MQLYSVLVCHVHRTAGQGSMACLCHGGPPQRMQPQEQRDSLLVIGRQLQTLPLLVLQLQGSVGGLLARALNPVEQPQHTSMV